MMPGRRIVRLLLLVVVPAIVVVAGLEWYARSTRWAETENAYVKANVVAVSAEVSGRVAEVGVRDQQRVEKGALLFAIDPAPYQLAVQRAQLQPADHVRALVERSVAALDRAPHLRLRAAPLVPDFLRQEVHALLRRPLAGDG